MHRDTQDELQRLSQALLEEEEAVEETPGLSDTQVWEFPDLEEDTYIQDVAQYNNHANNYGRVSNTDKTELSPEALSDALRTEDDETSGNGGLLFLAFVLLAAIVGVLIWWLVGR